MINNYYDKVRKILYLCDYFFACLKSIYPLQGLTDLAFIILALFGAAFLL